MINNYKTINQKVSIKLVLFVFAVFAFVTSMDVKAQLAMTRSIYNSAFTPITVGGGATAVAGVADDDVFATALPIGFTFNYLGTPYTTFTGCSNGWISFTATASNAANTSLYGTASPNATIAPWFDDLFTTEFLHQTSGAPGSQVCVIQWTSNSYWNNAGRVLRYQVKLYEGTNVIEFAYDAAPTGTLSANESASIGIESSTGGNGQYLDAVTGSAFTGNGYLQSDRWPTYNFRFTPGAPAAIAGGTYNVGVGQTFINLNEAAAEINHKGIAGPIVLNLTDAQYDITPANGANFFPIFFGPVAGTTAVNTVTVTKTGAPAIIAYGGNNGANGFTVNQTSAATSGTTEPIIGLIGADYFTVENLDIRGNVGNLTSDYGVALINSSATDGAQNNIIQNVSVTMNKTATATRGFFSTVLTTPTAASGANSNNAFRNFSISNAYAGIQLTGNATFPDLNNVIGNTVCTNFNTIGNPSVANDIGNGTTQTYGIRATSQSGISIYNNSIRNVTGSAVATDGIFVELFQGNSSLYNNKVQTIRNSGTASTTGISGIKASHATTGTSNLRIYNNSVSEIISSYTGTASANRTLKGIFISGTGGGITQSYDIYNNSVSIDGSSSPNNSSVCFEISTGSGPIYTLRNNVFANLTAAQTGVARHLGLFSTSATAFGNTGSTSNYNNVFIANDLGTSGFTVLGNLTTYNTLALWNTASTMEGNSLALNPNYLNSTSDLHAGNLLLNNAGDVLPIYITNDLDCAARTDNDMGAYNLTGCSGTPTAGSISGLNALCTGFGTTLNLTGASNDAGVTYQWASSTVPGGPYTNMGTTNSQVTGNLTASTYYIVTVTCSVSGFSAVTAEKSVIVNALPVVAINPTSGTYCTPGGTAVALAASGASTYTWLPAAGLSAATGANVNATPSATTTYTVTGTDGNGCINTATSAITVGAMPVISSVTASPSSVCSGANSQLQANATIAYNNTAAGYSFAGSTGTYTPIAGTVLGAGVIGDDVGIGNLPIGFTFNYNGAAHTVFGVSSNGLIQLSQTNATFGGLSGNSLSGNANSIAGLWDDNHTLGATVSYLLTGTAPNQVLTVQWTAMHVGGGGNNTNPTIDLQISLYEATGQIQIVYGSTSAALASTTASIGISGAVGNYLSVTPLSPASASTVSNTAENTGISAATNFPTGTIYTFTPPVAPTLTYAWLPPTFLNDAAIVNPLASAITASTTYTATVSSSLGCTATGTVAITAGAPLSATSTVSPSNTTCVGSTVTLQSVPVGGGGPFTYAWAGPNGFTSSQQDTTLTAVTAMQAGTYTVTITDNCGANTTSQVTLTINALPLVAVTPNSGTICLPGGSPVSLTGSGAATLTWLPATGLSATTGTNVNANPTVTTTYTVTGVDGNGCVNTATASILVSTNPTLTATATPSTICTGGNSQLLATASLPVTYVITNPSFSIEPTPTNNGPSGDDATSAALPIGFSFNYYGVTYTQFGISTNGNIQLGDGSGSANNPTYSGAFTDVAIPNAATPNNFIAIAWDDWSTAVGEIKYGTTGTAPNRKLVVSFNTTGRGGGLADTINGQIVLEETVNTIAINVVKKGIQAANTSTQGIENLTGSATSAGVLGRQNTAWSVNNQTTLFTPFSGVFNYSWLPTTYLDNAAIANPLASSVAASTVYTVTATEATTGCLSTQTVNVDLTPFSAVNITTAPSATVCAGVSVTLTAAPVGGGMPHTYLWSPGGETTAAITFNAASTQTYTVDVTDNCGTLVSQTVTLNVNQLPIVTATPSAATYCSPGTAIAIAATGADTYAWLPITSLDVANAANVNSSPASTITYTVTGTDALTNCTNTATVTITSAATPTVTASSLPATPVCAGDTVQLNSSAVIPVTYVQTTQSYSSETTPVTAGPSGDDAVSAALPIGFTFNYYGVNYTQFAISTNGNIQLGDGTGTANNPLYDDDYLNATIPNSAVPNNMIALAWDDWSVTAGQITYGVTGTSPNQKMVISFNTTGRGGGGADTIDGQIVLEETTNKIYMNTFKKGIQALNTATQGLENQTGGATSTIVVGRNNQAWSADKETRVFTPYSGTYTYSWSPSASLNDPTIANPAAEGIQTSAVYTITAVETSGCSASATVSVTVNPLPIVSLGTDITACSTDLPVSIDAGNAGATFLWSTTDNTQAINATTGGNYSVIVTDANGCEGKDTLVITENANPVVALGTDTTRCGGSVTIDAANAGSSYLWNDNTTAQTLTATATGTYSVVVTDGNGCTGNDVIDVTINTQPTVNLGNDTLVCGTGITLDAGNAGLAFLWNDNSTNQTLSATNSDTYFVEVTTPQNCSAKDTIVVTIAAPISVDLGNDSAVCASTTIILDAQNPGSSYLWNDNSTSSTLFVTTFGSYAVEVTSPDGCVARDTVVYADNSPAVSLTLPFSTTCASTSVNTLSGGLPVGGFYGGTGVTGSNFDATAVSAGNATIDYTFTDGVTGCSATASSIVVVDPCVGINQISSSDDYGVYPNPSNGQFEIRVPSKEIELNAKLYSAEGKLVYENVFSGRDAYSVNISELPNAVYFLKLYVDSGIKVIKVVKQF